MKPQRLLLSLLAATLLLGGGTAAILLAPRKPPTTAALEQRANRGRASYDELTDLGRRYLGQGRILDAGRVAFQARKAQPDRWQAYALIGEVYARAGQSRKAEENFQKAADLGPSQPGLDLAQFRIAHGMSADALIPLQEVTARDPQNPRAWLLMGEAQQGLGRVFEAEDAFRKALALQPKLAEANRGLGTLEMGFDHYGPAVSYLEQAYGLGDHSPQTRQALASALLMRGDGQDASRAERLIAEGPLPETPSAQFARALLLRAKGQYAEAARLFESIPASDQSHERAVFLLADCYRALGRPAQAEKEMQLYHRLVETRQQLGLLTHQLQQGAVTPALLRDLGKLLLESGRPDAAAEQFRAWAKLAPGDPEPGRWLARAQQAEAGRAPAQFGGQR